jgi:LysM repeat protein
VQDGDNLSKIAARFDTSVAELRGLNPQLAADSGAVGGQNLNPDVIFPGQEITLPPGTPGTDVYAGGVGTSADTMADIAKGNVPDSNISRAASLERLGQATPSAAGPAAAPTGPTNLAPNFDPANIPPGMKIRYSPPPLRESVKLIRLPAEQLIDQNLTVMAWALNESVGKAPARNMHLTRRGVLTVIENVDRHRRALLKELVAAGPDRTNIPAVPRQDMPLAPQDGVVKPGMIGKGLNWLDKATSKVGGYLSKQAQNFTRKVTAAKLKTEWEQEGHQTDSDYIAAFLTKQGVPQAVVTDVYSQMGIPYTAPATEPTVDPASTDNAGGASEIFNPHMPNPATGKPYTQAELEAKYRLRQAAAPIVSPPTTTPAAPTAPIAPTAPVAPTTATSTAPTTAASTFPGEDPQGPNYVGRLEVKRRQAARDAQAAKKPATANFGQQAAGYKSVNYAPNIKTGANLPKPAAAAPTKTPTQAEKDAYIKSIGAPAMAENRIATALKKPVAEMLQMVETKEDVQKIKQFVDQTFVRYGAVNESAFAVRNQILEHVTQVGAQRRREHARMS